MSGHIEHRESGASESSGQLERILTWHASKAMLPLVNRIALDMIAHHERLRQIRPELVRLEHNRRNLEWQGRSRRYQLEDELASIETNLKACRTELDALGVAILDEQSGYVGFPTLVNDRPAFFSWKPGELSLNWWNYAGDLTRRDVPEEWTHQMPTRPSRPKTRNRRK